MNRLTPLTVGLVALALSAATPVAAETLISLEDPELYELRIVGFELPRSAEVQIEAVGRLAPGFDSANWLRGLFEDDDRDEERLSVYAWILETETRRPVWHMSYDDTDRAGKHLREVEDSVRLAAGRYELYLFSGQRWFVDYRQSARDDDRPWWERMFSGDDDEFIELKEDLEDCYVKLSADGVSREEVGRFEPTGELRGAVIQHNRIGDTELAVSGFEIDRAMKLRLYGFIEKTPGASAAADYGWIIDATTRERVWTAPRSLDHGGGGRKNRLVDEEIELARGRYILYYGTDDSHSFTAFNTNPPYDPLNWGITILPGAGFSADAFRPFVPSQPPPLIDLTAAGDSEFLDQPFRLDAETELHIRALGEYTGRGDEFADRAWILDARTGESVWEMTHRNTVPAGGADKNRMFDGLVRLGAGDYVLSYATDDSHAAGSWNAATPFAPDAWGVSLSPGTDYDPGHFSLLSDRELKDDTGILVSIVRVGDLERRRERFTVTEPTRLSIYAVGEGAGGSMDDYGYIKDDRTGQTVWEMSYGETDHAGGARKNRRCNDEILVQPGTYEVVFETDGSHSFGDWNAASPADPSGWGIVVRRADG